MNNIDKIAQAVHDKKLLIFDFDGTIADTIDIEFDIYKRLLGKLNKKMTKAQWKELLDSHTAEGYLNLTNQMFGLSIGYDEFVDMYADASRYIESKHPPVLFEWVRPFLKKTSNIEKMILSNKDGNLIRENLVRLGVSENFPCVLSCTTLHTTKEETFPNVLIQYGVKPEECALFEDTPRYIDIGKNLGFTIIGVEHKRNKGQLQNIDFLIDTKNK